MKHRSPFAVILMASILASLPISLGAQGSLADYQRTAKLREMFQSLALNIVDRTAWIAKTSRFWYRRSVKEGFEFVVGDAENLTRNPAFDHEKLAASLSAATGETRKAYKLPFDRITFSEDGKAVEFEVDDWKWKCDLATYTCTKVGPAEREIWPPPWGSQYVPKEPKTSPDGNWEAFVGNFNIYVKRKEAKNAQEKDSVALSWDGTEGNFYSQPSIQWSPDSKKLAAYRVRPGYRRVLHYVESSPADQLQPKYSTIDYQKPGDALDVLQPVIFDLEPKKQTEIDNGLFPNAFEMSDLSWRKDGRALTFEYNQRGHQVYRVIEVDVATGKARAIISEKPKTFFCYSGKKYRYDVADGKEIVWMSERDGWNHLYLYDGLTGIVKNQITKGEWVVRSVDKVDEQARQIWFRASGMAPGRDPYFINAYRIQFDGTGLMALTEGDVNHTVTYSDDMKYFVDTYSRVDLSPVTQLLRSSDRKVLMEIERADIMGLVKAGWRAPEAFTAVGRDGKTGIWGIIVRPMAFDESRKYSVIENIYAGPHDSFVPKSFSAYNPMMALAEMGFIVVQIDGMGTSNRSKAFHDVCWKNLADAGFPDRILWHNAASAKYPYYDISRVGIYGTSAGGQSAMGALLFHPEFYKIAVASCGCHDNRMDKIWWNEQWMGWPIGPEYAACSNVDNAWRLKGKLLLYVGEMDTNVDPASTIQVVNALIKAGKTFEMLVLPSMNHTSGGVYGERKRYDFFVRHLLGIEPPDWNRIETKIGGEVKPAN